MNDKITRQNSVASIQLKSRMDVDYLHKMTESMRLSSGIVPVFRKNSDLILILILRAYNYWDFPKGLVEKGEDPLVAAKRELEEETGIKKIAFSYGKDFIETEPYNKGKIARYYIGEVFSDKVELGVNPELGKPEHQEYRWVTFQQAEELFVPRLKKVLHWAARQAKQ